MSANIEFVDRLWGEQGLVRWMMEQLPDAVHVSNLDTGELIYCNGAAKAITGFTPEELHALGIEGIRARIHPDDLERYLAGIRHLLEQGGSETLEYRWLHKDGSYRWLSNSRALLPTDKDNLKILVGTLRDVTAQKQAEQAHEHLLAEQTRERNLLKTIMENTSTDIAYLDRDFRFAQVNSAYVRDAGYSREELIGRNHFDLFPSAENQAISEQVRDTGEPVRFEAKPLVYANQPEKGVTYWNWTLVPVKGPEGHVEGLVLSLLDITEQERTRLALRESERRARVLLDSVPTTFFLMAPDGTLLALNAEAARRLKVPYEEAVGQNVYALLPPKAATRRRAWAEEVLRTRQPMRNQDERGGWVLDHRVHPVLDDEGRVTALAVYAEDITERVRTEKERERLLAEVQRHAAELDATLGAISDGLLILGPDDEVVRMNQAAEHLAGVTTEQWMRGSPVMGSEVIRAETADGRPLALEETPRYRAEHGEEVVGYHMALSRPDGSRRIVLTSAGPIRDAEGRVTGAVVNWADVTSEVALREQIETERARLQAMMQALPVGMAICDAQGGQVLTNRAYDRLWGEELPTARSVEDYDAYRAWWVDTGRLVAPDEWASAQAAQKGQAVIGQFLQIQRFDGTRAFVLNSATPVRDASGQIVGSAVAIQDVTELHHAQQTLRESEARYRSLYNATTAGIVLQDTEGRIVEANEAAEEIIGLTIDQMRGLTSMDPRWRVVRKDGSPFPGEEHPIVVARRSGQTVRDVTIGMTQPNGETHWMLVSAAPVMDLDTNVTMGAAATFIDITEQKETEQALRESEERYRTLFKTMTEGFALHEMLYDEQGAPNDYRFLEINSAFEQQTGLRATDVIGRTVREVIPDIEQLWIERYGEVVRTGEPVQFESWSGPLGHCYSVSAFRTGPGRFAVIFLDITDRVQAEGALRESEERFKLLADAAEQLLRSAQPQADIQQLGERVMSYLGADVFINFFLDEGQERLHLNACGGVSEELAHEFEWLDLGATVCGWVALHQQPAALEDIDLHQDPRAGLLRSMGVRAYACHPVFVDGQAVGTLSFGARSRGAFTEDELGLMRVVTDYVAIAMQRSRNAEALRDLNDTLEQRVAQRTVQLRALAAELSRAEERERKRLARVLHDHLQQLLVAARLNVNGMVRRMNDPSMHKAGQQVDQVLEEAIRTSRSLTAELSPPVLYDAGLTAALHWLARWFEEKYGLRVDVEAEELHNTTPEAARAMLFQAARELLFNVVKHAGVNRASIGLRRLPVGELELVISDYGMGFDPAQVEPTTEGGFGLFHLTERLEMLGGHIEVQSVPGQGTRIRLQVPEQQAGAQEVAAAEEVVGQLIRREANPPDEQETTHRPPLRVLLVDDHTIVREGLAHLLADEAGIQLVGQANNGREALELAHATRPDVVLMDVSMPVMDGIEATRCITDELPGVKVIGLSMYADPEVSQRMREAGAVDHIPKGGDPTALIQAIRQWSQHE